MTTKKMVKAAILAAIYAALTLILAPISFGPVQLRVSEALTILPIFSPIAIWGLTIGCLVSNLLGGFGVLDVVLGSFATLLGALGTRYFKNKPVLAALCPVISNALIIGPMLYFVVPDSPALLLNVLTVGVGELFSCVALGIPFYFLMKKHPKIFE